MPAREDFQYAILRVIPRVERGESLNAGVVLFSRRHGFLDEHDRTVPGHRGTAGVQAACRQRAAGLCLPAPPNPPYRRRGP